MTSALADETIALTALDRCDACSAQAFVVVSLGSSPGLLFCGHHFTRHESALLAGGWQVRDERWRINERPSASSAAFAENNCSR